MRLPSFAHVRYLYRSRQDPECARTLADHSWRALLATLAVAGLLAVLYGGWLLYGGLYYEPGGIDGVQADALSRTELREAIEALEQRSLDYHTLRTQAPAVVDPAR